MTIEGRVAVVVGLLLLFVVARFLYDARRRQAAGDVAPVPRVPRRIVDGADRTWVVFTTPFCASCGPVTERLRSNDPAARVVTVDATRDPRLASAFRVRRAPTVLLADAAGDVRARLVGVAAVDGYFQAGRSTAAR